jgi:PAS domain S-box-containing protein
MALRGARGTLLTMSQERSTIAAGSGVRRISNLLRYGLSILAMGGALLVWAGVPLLHQDPFALFLLSVVACARFLGVGPAVLCAGLSVAAIDYVVFEPHFAFSSTPEDLARLGVFLGISLLAASMARQRSEAEVNAEDTRRKLAAIVEFSDDAIYSTTLDGTVLSWNRAAQALYGYSASEVVGTSWALAFPPERALEFQDNLGHLLRGEPMAYKTERLRKDGSRVSVLLSLSPLRDEKGHVVGASAIARDITAQLQAEEAMRRNEKLANAGRLTAVIAHEINNPLEAVTNLLYLARQDPKRSDQHLKMAEREVQRIAEIVQQTLGFVRDLSDAAPVSVSATLDEVVQVYLARLNSKNIHTEIEFSDDDTVHGFGGELRQLFSNLVANAIDALDEGGRLRLRVTRISAVSNGRQPGVRVLVADNGSGIRLEDRGRIFEPFFTTKRDSGTGLGLWLSEGIVRRHGGRIRLRTSTRSGRSGTAFSIFLPQAPVAPTSQPQGVPA